MHNPALDPTFAILVVYGFVAHAFQRLVNRVRIYAALALLQLYRSLCWAWGQVGHERKVTPKPSRYRQTDVPPSA